MEAPSGPHWSDRIEEADWIERQLAPFAERVTSVVAAGFQSYARVLHPVAQWVDDHERPVRWQEVAAWSGLPLRPGSQFHSIALPPTDPATPTEWRGDGPRQGQLFAADAEVLAEILRPWTSTPEDCWFCVWDGYGWGNAVQLTPPGQPGVMLPDPVPDPVRQGPRVHLPNRDYLLYSGPVEAVMATVPLANSGQTPNLWWPSDHSWCVATEIDLAWTYVGGPEPMIEHVLTDKRIEAVSAEPGDPLTRVEDWIRGWVDTAVDELLRSGEAAITTSRGTVTARLYRPSRIRRGVLSVARTRVDRGSGGSSHYLGRQDEEDLRDTVASYLTWDVIGLVGG